MAEISTRIMLPRHRLIDCWMTNHGGESQLRSQTRRWEEVRPTLMNMVAAARAISGKSGDGVALGDTRRR